jgi:hypothetical protein
VGCGESEREFVDMRMILINFYLAKYYVVAGGRCIL